jgi:hypothetical protein
MEFVKFLNGEDAEIEMEHISAEAKLSRFKFC